MHVYPMRHTCACALLVTARRTPVRHDAPCIVGDRVYVTHPLFTLNHYNVEEEDDVVYWYLIQ
jgi:hypothetical protein